MVNKIHPYKGIANVYEEIRPSYPERLIEDIISKSNLKASDRLLEIGAGTGKATVQFAEKGFEIQAVEPGEDMAEILKTKCAKFSKVNVDVVSFEDWEPKKDEKYDMIYCAQAFHWLDTTIKYKKCSKYLKEEGYLVLFWYSALEEETETVKEISQKVQEVIARYDCSICAPAEAEQRLTHKGTVKDDERKAEIEASGLFKVAHKIEYTEEVRNNAEKYLKARKTVPTFASIQDKLDSSTIVKMDNEIKEIINEHGGYVSTCFNFVLYICAPLKLE